MPDPAACPDAVLNLVERFNDHRDHYKAQSYNETQVRREFVDPLFEALGWDVSNKQGFAEAYKEVIHEASVRIGGAAKAPDYAFRIGSTTKFFVETKKPAVNLKLHPESAYQLRRYAWSAKLPLSVLTDFEELVVYDTRVRPQKSDSPSKARILYITFDEFETRWAEIVGVFSRDAILKGAFDKYAESKKKRGTTEVDDAFLDTIRDWRQALAKDIHKRNTLSERQLNQAVQAVIDRIIFLRICEDRGAEEHARLLALKSAPEVYPALVSLFREADARYNSGLFHFEQERGRASEPDTVTPDLAVSDRVLKKIIDDLYYPSPYDFRVFPPDVLGQVYERFLGEVITFSATGKTPKVEPKPEVRKAGGVYYTPTYIVDYIVQHTVGELVKDKKPHEVAGRTEKTFKPRKGAHPIRALDPACGSGSFLLGAYQFLLDWFLDRYTHDPKPWVRLPDPPIVHSGKADKEYRLSISERKRILIDHIYGVDIDRQAVEVTKLSLLLKCLEGESSDSIGAHLFHMKERALPDLAANIKCGNSLIGTDFYADKDPDQFRLEERMRINAFDWKQEFKPVFADGSFDAVIGNPPYLNIDDVWGKGDPKLEHLKRAFKHVYRDKSDLYYYFLSLIPTLARERGGMIVSRAFLEAYKADGIRGLLSKKSPAITIIDFRDAAVFPGVGIQTAILIADPTKRTEQVNAQRLRPGHTVSRETLEPARSGEFESFSLPTSMLGSDRWTLRPAATANVLAKIAESGTPIAKICHVGKGMETGVNSAFAFKTRGDLENLGATDPMIFHRARNSDIERFRVRPDGPWLLYPHAVKAYEELPKGLRKHLEDHRDQLENRAAFKRGNCKWWQFTWPLHEEHVRSARILCPYQARTNRFAVDSDAHFLGLTDTTIVYDLGQPESLYYLSACLNSRALVFYHTSKAKMKGGGVFEYFWNNIGELPIPRPDTNSTGSKKTYDRVAEHGVRAAKLAQQVATTLNSDERRILQQQIDATDREIDRLVYELYGLTDEEIAIVERATEPAG